MISDSLRLAACLAIVPCISLAEEVDGPVIDLDPFSVEAQERLVYDPNFRLPSPAFSYAGQPDLPNGELILALNFIDGYRDLTVPGREKWAGILQIPHFDANERFRHLWVVVYTYADGLWGYIPGARVDSLARFKLPVAVEDKFDTARIATVAERLVFEYTEEWQESPMFSWTGDDEEGFGDEDYYFDEPRFGRIGGIGAREGLSKEELVRFIYVYEGEPAYDLSGSEYGPPPRGERNRFSIGDLFRTHPRPETHLSTARELLKPRWTMAVMVEVQMPRPLPFLPHGKRRYEILFFNVGNRLLAYNPVIGVWMQPTPVSELTDEASLMDALILPGGQKPTSMVEIELKS